jgi:hypothetical protein
MRETFKQILFAGALIGGIACSASAQTTFYFPQIADGGAFSTTIFITNPSSSPTPANVTITLTASNGLPMSNVTLVDNLGAAHTGTVSLQLPGGRSQRLVSTAASPTTLVGFATVTSDLPVTGSAVFSQFNASVLLGEAGVGASPAGTSQAIFVDETPPFTTALAYANPSETAAANVNFNLLDSSGATVQSTARVLMPRNHSSLFVNQLFTGAPVVNHVGTMQVLSDQPLAIVSLRFAGTLFTSVPPFALAGIVSPMVSPLQAWMRARVLPAPLAAFSRVLAVLRSSLA